MVFEQQRGLLKKTDSRLIGIPPEFSLDLPYSTSDWLAVLVVFNPLTSRQPLNHRNNNITVILTRDFQGLLLLDNNRKGELTIEGDQHHLK